MFFSQLISLALFCYSLDVRVVGATSYYLEVVTGSVDSAGTDAKISLTVSGSSGNTGPLQIQTYFDSDPFETSDINYIYIQSDDIGKVEELKISHDNTGKGPGWFLSKIIMTVPSQEKRYVFTPGRWVEKDVVTEKPSSVEDVSAASYYVEVETGTIEYAGTDANVYLLIFGSSGNLGPFHLEAKPSQFNHGCIDNFILKATDIGELKGIKIAHDNTGGGPGWFLTRFTMTVPSQEKRYVFTTGRWVETDLAKVVMDKPSSIEDVSAASYYVEVETGTVEHAGTDANVYLYLFGSSGNLGPFQLEAKPSQLNLGCIDNFILKATDIGELKGIKVTHDNTGGGAGWFLDKITITVPSQEKRYVFTHGRWVETDLAKVVMDKPSSIKDVSAASYHVEVETGTIEYAGTDANVYLYLFGSSGNLGPFHLEAKLSQLNHGCIDNFILKAADIGELKGVKITHDNTGGGPGWYLKRMTITVPSKNMIYDFTTARWVETKFAKLEMYKPECTCTDQVKTSTDGYFATSYVPVNTEAECKAKCTATAGCTLGLFFGGECHLTFNLEPKSTNSADTCKQLCTSTFGCKTFRYSGSTCTLFKKHFNRLVANPGVSIATCLNSENLPCLK